jgi:glycosyltransferase involved in cell wall biosynthesis
MHSVSIGLVTGGSDKPYAVGLATALGARGVSIDFIGSDELDCSEVRCVPNLTFLNLRGDQREAAPAWKKACRVVSYYGRLLHYAATGTPRILHILWNNRFELFDRTVLMLYYRALGKRIVFTAHNVNAAARNGDDSWLNRASLRIQYHLCDHVFVHTAAMKQQLQAGFGVPESRISVVPFGINDTIPRTGISRRVARRQLGIAENERALLCFGQIAPYKGLECLVEAVSMLAERGEPVKVILAGKVKRGSEGYWRRTQCLIADLGIGDLVAESIGFIPDEQVEPYFCAADAVVLPYVDIFQSGVPFLAFSFGIPVIATDVGSLREDVTNETGLLCRPKDSADLARAILAFYQSGLHPSSPEVQARIRRFAEERHSWEAVSDRTMAVYASLAPALEYRCDRPSKAHARSEAGTKCQG